MSGVELMPKKSCRTSYAVRRSDRQTTRPVSSSIAWIRPSAPMV